MKYNEDIEPRWLSITQACRYTGMSDKTLMRYIKDSSIFATRKGGKWYVDKQSIDSFFHRDEIYIEETLARLREKVT